MDAQAVAFAIVAVVALVSGIGVVTTRNVAHAALFLLVSLASVAGVFILLVAEFLALVQILIYGGAVTIVLLFALMLTRTEDFSKEGVNRQWAVGAVAALGVFGAMAAVVLGDRLDTQELRGPGLQELGSDLFTNWVVPFEIASLVLLMALIGAIILARASDSDSGNGSTPGSGG